MTRRDALRVIAAGTAVVLGKAEDTKIVVTPISAKTVRISRGRPIPADGSLVELGRVASGDLKVELTGPLTVRVEMVKSGKLVQPQILLACDLSRCGRLAGFLCSVCKSKPDRKVHYVLLPMRTDDEGRGLPDRRQLRK